MRFGFPAPSAEAPHLIELSVYAQEVVGQKPNHLVGRIPAQKNTK